MEQRAMLPRGVPRAPRPPHPRSGRAAAPRTLVVVTRASSPFSSPFATDRTDLVEFLREDLSHLFDDQGIDTTFYDDGVAFRDPITKYDTVADYVKNIQFLRRVFLPEFTLHDIKQTGEDEITFRWTMDMRLAGIHRELVFTGTSRLGVNRASGKFCSHLDTWDAIQNQEYFSAEAFLHMLGQLFVERTDALEGDVLLKRKEFEVVRRADGRVVAVFLDDLLGGDVAGRDARRRRILERDGIEWGGDEVDEFGGLVLEGFQLPPL